MATAKSKACASVLLILLVVAGGCVVGDQVTTFTLNPDGSADLVIFRSNLRSTEKGDKATSELADYKARFDARSEDELARVRDSGGAILDASWIRRQVPFSSLVHAQFPNASAIEKYLTIKNEDGSYALKTQFHSDGTRRSFSFQVSLPAGKNGPNAPPPGVEQFRQSLANGISETRVALAKGTITTARGFTVAGDKQSALLDADAIGEIMRTGGKGELYLEWEVTP